MGGALNLLLNCSVCKQTLFCRAEGIKYLPLVASKFHKSKSLYFILIELLNFYSALPMSGFRDVQQHKDRGKIEYNILKNKYS